MSLPRYPTYRRTGFDRIPDVPEHWDVLPLGRLGTLLKGSGGSKEDIVEIGLPCVRYGDLYTTHSHTIQQSRTQISEAVAARYTRLHYGDVLFAASGETFEDIGKSAVNLIDGEAYCGGDVVILRSSLALAPRFMGYAADSLPARQQKASLGRGTTVKHIYPDELRKVVVAVPPEAEQTTIADFLDYQMSAIDELLLGQRRLIELLNEKRQALISRAVTTGLDPDAPMKSSGVEWLGDVPAHWDVPRIAELFREVSETGSGELPILSVSIHHGVSDEELAEEALDRKVTRSEDRTKYKRVAPNDLVYNMMRAWQGGFGTVRVEGMVSPAYVVARPLRALDTQYVEYLLRSPQAVEEMRRHSRGITDFRLRLYWDEFKNMRIPLPPPQEVSAICAHISETTERFDGLTATCERSVRLLEERRTALISAAVTGQIDVRGLVAAAAADLRVGPTGHPAAARTTTRGRSAAEVA